MLLVCQHQNLLVFLYVGQMSGRQSKDTSLADAKIKNKNQSSVLKNIQPNLDNCCYLQVLHS